MEPMIQVVVLHPLLPNSGQELSQPSLGLGMAAAPPTSEVVAPTPSDHAVVSGDDTTAV